MPLAASAARPVELRAYTTLRVGGPAELWEVGDSRELQRATEAPYRILGAGSNLLVADRGVSERVIKLGRNYNSLAKLAGQTDVWLGASTPLPGLVRRAQKQGLSGLEGLLGIPATLGGAVAMNAGTRFGAIADTLQEVEVFWHGKLERLPATELDLDYRSATLPPGAIITQARLALASSTPERVALLMRQVDEARRGQPKNKSAGCAFKNPPNDSAGRLIDEAGLKGLRIGDAMISFEHGNFIVNLGNAKAMEVLELIERIRNVLPVRLELEWRLWGVEGA